MSNSVRILLALDIIKPFSRGYDMRPFPDIVFAGVKSWIHNEGAAGAWRPFKSREDALESLAKSYCKNIS